MMHRVLFYKQMHSIQVRFSPYILGIRCSVCIDTSYIAKNSAQFLILIVFVLKAGNASLPRNSYQTESEIAVLSRGLKSSQTDTRLISKTFGRTCRIGVQDGL